MAARSHRKWHEGTDGRVLDGMACNSVEVGSSECWTAPSGRGVRPRLGEIGPQMLSRAGGECPEFEVQVVASSAQVEELVDRIGNLSGQRNTLTIHEASST